MSNLEALLNFHFYPFFLPFSLYSFSSFFLSFFLSFFHSFFLSFYGLCCSPTHFTLSQLAAKDFRISALEAQLVNSAQESSREMAKLRTELFEMQIQGLGGMSDDIDGNTSSTYGNQFSSPRDYVPSIQIQSNNMDSDLSTPDSGKHAARRRTSLQPNVMSGTPVSGVSVVRPPSGNAVKAANALRNSNTDLIELKASSTAGNLV